jgi:hypothetical protein
MMSEEPPAPGAVRPVAGKPWEIEISSLEALTQMIDTLEEPLILSRRKGPGSPTTNTPFACNQGSGRQPTERYAYTSERARGRRR